MDFEDSPTGTEVPEKLDKDSDSERFNMIVPKSWLHEIDVWRATQQPILTRSKAIRVIVTEFLKKAKDDDA